MKQAMKYAVQMLSDVVYPRRCPVCDGILLRNEPLICRRCAGRLKLISQPVCCQCGRPLRRDGAEYCAACRKYRHAYDQGCAPFLYAGEMQDSMMRFKYHHRPEYAGFYASVLARYASEYLGRWQPDVIVPVPIHRTRYISRGYNQAEELAVKLSAKTGIPVSKRGIVRIRRTKPQKGLSGLERRKNLHGAFAVRPDFRVPERVLVVDDIYTTGSTIDEMARTLRENGAKMVFALCVCITAADA